MRFTARDLLWFVALVAALCAWHAETTKYRALVDELRTECKDLEHRLYVVKDRRDWFWQAGRWRDVPSHVASPVMEDYDSRDRME